MRTQHHWRAVGYTRDVVDEDDPEGFKVLDDELVVDNLVITKDWWLEYPRHPVQRLNGFFNARAESSRRREYHLVDVHPT